MPVLGVVLYVMLGINRVQRRATSLAAARGAGDWQNSCVPESIPELVATQATHLMTLAKLVGELDLSAAVGRE